MQNQQVVKKVYATIIHKKGSLESIIVKESEDFDSCFKLWDELTKLWGECVKESMPFVLKDPIVTSFDPGLILEISVVPLQTTNNSFSSSNHNPYANKMKQDGFAETMRSYTSGPDILDRGYKSN